MADIPGDTSTTETIVLGGSRSSDIEDGPDQDWFRVHLTHGQYAIDLKGGTLSDPEVFFYDSTGTQIAYNDDVDGGSFDSRLPITITTEGDYYIGASGLGGATGTYEVSISEDIPADTSTIATIAIGGSVTSEIGFSGDQDWFKVYLTPGRYVIDETGDSLGDPFLRLFDSTGTLLTENDDDGPGFFDAQISIEITTAGEYYISGGAFGSGTGTYSITLAQTPTAPSIGDFAASTVFWSQPDYTITEFSLNISNFVVANDFVPDENVLLSAIDLVLQENSSASPGVFEGFAGVMSIGIYTDSGTNSPGTLLFSGTDYSVTANVIGSGPGALDVAEVSVDITETLLTGGTTYWIVMHEGAWGSVYDGTTVRWLQSNSVVGTALHYSEDEQNPAGWVPYPTDNTFVLRSSGSLTFAENTVNASPQVIDNNVTITDWEGNFDGGTLVISGLLAEDTVQVLNEGTGAGQVGVSGNQVYYGGVVIGTFAGGAGSDLTITFNAAATTEAVENVFEQLAYGNTSDDPTASRALTLTLTDDTALSDTRSVTINVTPDEDIPVARNDHIITNEGVVYNGSVFADNGSGPDSDPDDPLVVGSVDGQAGLVGADYLLPSGSTVRINADGSLIYTPGGAATQLAAIGSGASNTSMSDNFDYSLVGGGTGNVTIVVQGTDGYDTLLGTSGVDSLFGGQFDDVLIGGLGADSLDGGTGTDTASYAGDGGAVFVNLSTGQGYANSSFGDTYTSIENVTGTDYNDFLIGDTGVNVLDGGAGNDTIIGGLGPDVLIGGAGIDTLSYEDNSGTVFVNLLTGMGYNNAAQGDTYSGFENVIGGLFDDTIIGDHGANRLDGAMGADTLVGNGGADTFVFAHAPGATNPFGSPNVDTIFDFVSGEDRIEINASAFGGGLTAGALAGDMFLVGSQAGDANDRFVYDQANGNLWFDADGNGAGAPVLVAILPNQDAIAATDFIIV